MKQVKDGYNDFYHEEDFYPNLREENRTWVKYEVFVSGDETNDLFKDFYISDKAIEYAKSLKAEGKSVTVYKSVYSQYGEEDSQIIWEDGKDLRNVSDSRKIKDAKMRKVYLGTIPTGLYFNFQGRDWKVVENKHGDTVVCEMIDSGKIKEFNDVTMVNLYGSIFDSKKIKDADETQDVLDGILMIAFNDGSEEEGYNEVKKHANEQGELDGVQYETYDTDIQDGVTLIDLCAATDDANAFVKALLTEWGIIDAVADIEFEKSELMENAEVSDSRRVSDYRSPLDAIENAFNSVANELGTEQLSPKFYEKVNKYIKTYPIAEGANSCTIVYQGAKYDVSYDFRDNRFYASKDEWNLSEAIEKRRKLLGVSDSKVEDMTKPAHLRGYAEKYRKKRREQKESYKENEEETQDKEVSDSRRIKDYVVGTKHPQEYFAELCWMLESLKKRGYIDAYLDDDIIKGFAEYYDYPSLREFNEWGDEEVAAGFDEYLESLE